MLSIHVPKNAYILIISVNCGFAVAIQISNMNAEQKILENFGVSIGINTTAWHDQTKTGCCHKCSICTLKLQEFQAIFFETFLSCFFTFFSHHEFFFLLLNLNPSISVLCNCIYFRFIDDKALYTLECNDVKSAKINQHMTHLLIVYSRKEWILI